VDLSTSYELNDHLTISLEGLSLIDEANDQFMRVGW
jgi:nitrate reductase assembly molybdenum cofactor insertion protein NarJ